VTACAEPAASDNREAIPDAALVAARATADKLGENTVILSMGELLGVTEAFVITSGRNTRQVRTIVDEVKVQVKTETGRVPWSVEGTSDMRWVLMDYGDFLVHVFVDEARQYYDLERLWGNAPRLNVGGGVAASVSDAPSFDTSFYDETGASELN
jgi:ribosome-associated protein